MLALSETFPGCGMAPMGDLFPLESRVRGDDGRRQAAHVIRCSRCPSEDAVAAHRTRYPTAHLTGTFQQRGWRVSQSGRHVCPTCIASETEARRAKHSKEPAPMPAPEKVISAPPLPSPAASSAIVTAYLLLEDHYDKAAKAYRAGWSDERVAKESGLAVEAVAKRREADFGPLVVDTTAQDLRHEWDGLRSDIKALRTGAGQLALLLKGLDEREARLAKRLDAVGEKAGYGALTAPVKAA
ncbi:MAG: hypothetical protein AB1592_13220 [Pseudomonadota bacterium]